MEPLREACLRFATTQARGFSPLYERLSLGIADDKDLLTLLSEAPTGQARPTLLLAAVHDLLLGGMQHPLADFYLSVTGSPRTDDPWVAFRDFCHTFRSAVQSRIQRGATQTNEVRRAGALMVGLQYVQATASRPIRLVELGASAGLLLAFDRYLFEFTRRQFGLHTSPVRIPISTDEETEALLGSALPSLKSRVGVDLQPIDLRESAQRQWLDAFVWPEASDDRHRLRAAMALVAEDPPHVLRGDAIEILPSLLDDDASDFHLVVFHTTLLTYLDHGQRQALFQILGEAGASRDLYWLPLEAPGFLTKADVAFDLPAIVANDNSRLVLALRQWTSGMSHDVLLARVDAYGRSMDRGWLRPDT
jgi:hypothetical protein